MKLYIIHTKRWLGPKTPYVGIVREENEEKAIEAFMDPMVYPFGSKPHHFKWYERYRPSLDDFMAKQIGYDTVWPNSFPESLRDPEINAGPVYSSEETVCKLFMSDRVIIRVYNDGSSMAAFVFGVKLAMADFFYFLGSIIGDKAKDREQDLLRVE